MPQTEILQHNIEWNYFHNDKEFPYSELPESEEEHIRDMIIQGYNQGELNYYDAQPNSSLGNEDNYRGWWSISRN